MSDAGQPSSTVIVCAYTLDRLELTERCLTSVLAQDPRPDQVVAVIDHNDELQAVISGRFPTVEVIANRGPQGLSEARNSGVDVARGDVIAFVDDDAEPRPGWLGALLDAFRDPKTMVVGGLAIAAWETGQPSWFPDEYLWVVGCSYQGQRTAGRIRNPLGCNMAFRREVFELVGGFEPAVGRLGSHPVGAEETELCVRLVRAKPEARIAIVSEAVVDHAVPAARGEIRYFVRRCYYEGVSKAVVHGLSDHAALVPEGDFILRTLTRGTVRRLGAAVRVHRPFDQLRAITALWLGLGAAGVGYLYGKLRSTVLKAGPVTPAASTQADDGTGTGVH